MVLGSDAHSVVLVQAGAPLESEIATIHVVGGTAIAFEGVAPGDEELALAEQTAVALKADLVSVQTAQISGQLVV